MASRSELRRRQMNRPVWVAIVNGAPARAWVGTRKEAKMAYDVILDQPYRMRRYEPARPKRKGVVDR